MLRSPFLNNPPALPDPLTFEKKNFHPYHYCKISQSVITCSKLTIKTLEEGVKYVQN